jgi:hypothetical protein
VKTCSVRGITYPSVSYLSQKVMSEVSVSRRRSPLLAPEGGSGFAEARLTLP